MHYQLAFHQFYRFSLPTDQITVEILGEQKRLCINLYMGNERLQARARGHPATVLGYDRLEIRMSDSTSDLPKPSDRLKTRKFQNHETCLKAGLTVSSVVYKAADVDHRYKR